jgi:hypothetical protein
MKRIFENVVNDDSEFEFKVFKYHKDHGELFDLLTTYTSKGKFFKIKAKELKKSECDSKLVSELGIAPDDILIVEVISKTMLVKPFIRIATESVNCSFCFTSEIPLRIKIILNIIEAGNNIISKNPIKYSINLKLFYKDTTFF